MRIGIVLSKAPSYSETFFISKIKGLKESGYHVVLFVQENDTNFSLCEVKSIRNLTKSNKSVQFLKVISTVFKLLINSPKRFFKFIKLEREVNRSWTQIFKNFYNNSHILNTKLDWLHFGFTTISIQSENVAKTIDAKMAVSFRGYDIDVYPLENPGNYNLIWKNLDKVHSISNYLVATASQLGMPESIPVQIIHPAVNLSQFKIEPKTYFSKNQFLTVARLHWIKGLTNTIEAMALLKKQGLDFNYNIVGDGPERENLITLIKKLQLEDEVKLVGRKTHDEVVEYYDNSNYYIQYSESEGFCNSVLEAQAKGLLCIVSNGGALPENVLNEETGWVVPKKNTQVLADTILKIIALPNQVKKNISIKAQKRVKTQFSVSSQKRKFKAFYEIN